MVDALKGLLKIIWMIVQLLWMIAKGLMLLGNLSCAAIRESAYNITCSFVAWVTGLLLMSPFEYTGGESAISSATDNSAVKGGIGAAFNALGFNGLPLLCIEAGLALTMIWFFYGFAESTVQLDKTNLQLIFSRILRWIIAVGLVTVSYLLFAYLFSAFRSLFSLSGASISTSSSFDSIKGWFQGQLYAIKPPSYDGDDQVLIDSSSVMTSDMSVDPTLDGSTTGVAATMSLRNGGIGCVILIFGLIKLVKKAIKFVVEQIPAFAKVVVFFLCAPFGLAMYAAPETQQKANQYLRQFAGAVMTNLFKVIAIALATLLACKITYPVDGGAVSVLNTMPVVADMIGSAFTSAMFTDTTDLANDLAFLVTSGGLLGYQLYFDLVGKASEVAERFSHEIMT